MSNTAMPMTGDTDKDFAMMMKMHHQKGLEMAKTDVAEGNSRQMKAMAQKIVDSQTKEIAEFDKWLAAQKYHLTVCRAARGHAFGCVLALTY